MTPAAAAPLDRSALSLSEAEAILGELAAVFAVPPSPAAEAGCESPAPDLEEMYRVLVEQIPAVVFMAYLDRGMGSAYVSPRIEQALGFSQGEWLEDPVRWYHQIHPEDQQRWSVEAADMFLTGKPLKSAYRVLARNGRVIWFQCEAKMVRRPDGRPWFIHGVGFDITELKRAEQGLEEERNVVSAILDTVGALVVVLAPDGRILRANRATETISGYSAEAVQGRYFWDVFLGTEEAERFRPAFRALGASRPRSEHESDLLTATGGWRRIAWSSTLLPARGAAPPYAIVTGIDITERKRMEKAILDVGARAQRQIGNDLHDGLGQHLTGIAFMGRVLQQKLASGTMPDVEDAARIVRLVNEAINKTRELARGLQPVVSDAHGLMGALSQWADEVEDLFRIGCRFCCPEPVLITDEPTAAHLYHIAHEAVNNALRHAAPKEIVIGLAARDGTGCLTVEDDGSGLAADCRERGGLGLQIMGYRASMIGGSLDVRPGGKGGTVVACRFPLESLSGRTTP
jgi:PAS domain S-box-containing protein